MVTHWNRSLSDSVALLRGAYPVTAQILGESGFDAAALAFALRYTSAHSRQTADSSDFAEFLAAQLPIADAPHLADVATLERLWADAHAAADAPCLELDGLPDDEAAWTMHRLSLHPAAGFIWLKTPAVTVWEAHQKGCDKSAPEFLAEGALVTRKNGRVALRSITRPEHRLLSALGLGEALGQVAEATTALYPETNIATVLASLTSSGAFAA